MIRNNARFGKKDLAIAFVLGLFGTQLVWAAAGGSLSGSIKDPSGASVPHAEVTITNTDLKSQFKSTSDAQGFYSFPGLPVGHYDLRIEAQGFTTQEKKNLTVDADAALRVDVVLDVGPRQDVVISAAAPRLIQVAAKFHF